MELVGTIRLQSRVQSGSFNLPRTPNTAWRRLALAQPSAAWHALPAHLKPSWLESSFVQGGDAPAEMYQENVK